MEPVKSWGEGAIRRHEQTGRVDSFGGSWVVPARRGVKPLLRVQQETARTHRSAVPENTSTGDTGTVTRADAEGFALTGKKDPEGLVETRVLVLPRRVLQPAPLPAGPGCLG